MNPLKHISIEISTECNGACKMCPCDLIDSLRPGQIDYHRIVELFEEIKEFPELEYIEFHNYNEPLLHPEYFFYFASRARSILGEKKIGIVTNGSTMTEILAWRILELEPHHVWFSLDSLVPDVYERIRPGLKLLRVLSGINHFWKAAKEKEFPVGIIFTVMEENKGEVEYFKRYWTEKGNCQVFFQWCDGRGWPIKERAYSNPDEGPCDYVLENAIVLTNLDVVPCCIDWQGKSVMGNLKEKNMKEIWQGEKFQRFRRQHLAWQKKSLPICSSCQTALIHNRPRY